MTLLLCVTFESAALPPQADREPHSPGTQMPQMKRLCILSEAHVATARDNQGCYVRTLHMLSAATGIGKQIASGPMTEEHFPVEQQARKVIGNISEDCSKR